MAINEPDGEAPPRLFLARGRANHLVRFRSDVPPPTVEACLRLCALLALGEANATRAGKTLTYRTAKIYDLRDGRITERWAFSDDTAAIVAFFA